jgi:hypothetical protein
MRGRYIYIYPERRGNRLCFTIYIFGSLLILHIQFGVSYRRYSFTKLNWRYNVNFCFLYLQNLKFTRLFKSRTKTIGIQNQAQEKDKELKTKLTQKGHFITFVSKSYFFIFSIYSSYYDTKKQYLYIILCETLCDDGKKVY